MSKRSLPTDNDTSTADNSNSSPKRTRSIDVHHDASAIDIWKSINLQQFDVKVLFQYIRSGKDVSAHDPENYGLLYLAARNESAEAMRMLLLQPTIDVNELHGPNHELALHAAATAGHVDGVELLLEHGSSLNVRDGLGHSPLASTMFSKSVECLDLFIQAGADTHFQDGQGNTLLHLAAINGFGGAIDKLVDTEVDKLNQRGLSPLAVAIGLGHVDAMKRLLACGADVNGRIRFGNSILHHAVTWNRIEAVQAVVEAGGEVNVRNEVEETPLLLAVQQRKIDMVQYLIQHGADPCFAADGAPKVNMPLMYAANHGYTEMCDLLITVDTSDFFLQSAAELSHRASHVNTAKLLLDKLQERKRPVIDETEFDALINTFSDDEESSHNNNRDSNTSNGQDNNNAISEA